MDRTIELMTDEEKLDFIANLEEAHHAAKEYISALERQADILDEYRRVGESVVRTQTIYNCSITECNIYHHKCYKKYKNVEAKNRCKREDELMTESEGEE